MKANIHWLDQRISAGLLFFLLPWFAINVVNTSPEYWIRYFSKSLSVMALILITLSALYHMYLGIQIILEDYVPHLKLRNFLNHFMKVKIFILLVFSFVCFVRLIVIGMHLNGN
ncbi:MAG: succinate dehydrogenase, hydrophobic membrane anchor protein [Proteobacteria bacterium]|nr:succinate dehydrogenase, hydrophobic membrane anchor protein [Pseudomonadota bacterium]